MVGTKSIKQLNRKDSERFRHAFLKGMSNILVFGKKPRKRKAYNNFEALNHDINFTHEDLIEALIKAIGELPPEKKDKLKNKLIECGAEEEQPQMTFEFKGYSKELKNEQKEREEKGYFG